MGRSLCSCWAEQRHNVFFGSQTADTGSTEGLPVQKLEAHGGSRGEPELNLDTHVYPASWQQS